MSASLEAFTGSVIYFDTMLPYALLRGLNPAVKLYFDRLANSTLQAFTSVLTFDALAYRLLLALIKDQYSGSPLDRLRDNEEDLIAEFAPRVVTQLRRLRDFPNLVVLDVLASDLDLMHTTIIQYRLRPRDALHFVAMQRVGCFDLASNDHHFDRIPQLHRFSF